MEFHPEKLHRKNQHAPSDSHIPRGLALESLSSCGQESTVATLSTRERWSANEVLSWTGFDRDFEHSNLTQQVRINKVSTTIDTYLYWIVYYTNTTKDHCLWMLMVIYTIKIPYWWPFCCLPNDRDQHLPALESVVFSNMIWFWCDIRGYSAKCVCHGLPENGIYLLNNHWMEKMLTNQWIPMDQWI